MTFHTIVKLREDGDADVILAINKETTMLVVDDITEAVFIEKMVDLLLMIAKAKTITEAMNNDFFIIELENVDEVIENYYLPRFLHK